MHDGLLHHLRLEAAHPRDVVICIGNANVAPLSKIIEHRNQVYRQHGMTYLVEASNKNGSASHDLDRRSTYLWALDGETLVGSLRLLNSPYEADFVVEPRPSLPKNYVEISRLAVAKKSAAVTRKLISSACIYGLEQGHAGVVAICRAVQRRLFERLGMHVLKSASVRVPSRNGDAYWLMGTNWPRLAAHHIKPTIYPTVIYQWNTAQ